MSITTTPALAPHRHEGPLALIDPETGQYTDTPDFAEIDRLITLAQSAPCAPRVITDEDGNEDEVLVWSYDRDAELALDKLTNAYLPLLHSTAHKLRKNLQEKGLDKEEALGHLLAEFVDYVRNIYVVGQADHFAHTIKRILTLALHDREREADLIAIPATTKRRYLSLIEKHNGDANAAYKDCKSGNLDPQTFLAIHNSLNVSDNSLDGSRFQGSQTSTAGDDNGSPMDAELFKAGHYSADPAEEVAQASLIEFIINALPEDQAQIVKLKHGFDDAATRNLRVAAGFPLDHEAEELTDKQVGEVMGLSRQKVQRVLDAANKSVRKALQD